jgi:enoyl-CoA hydratase
MRPGSVNAFLPAARIAAAPVVWFGRPLIDPVPRRSAVSNVETAPNTYKHMQVERRDNVTIVTISRPEKYNALNRAVLSELDSVFRSLTADASVRAIVLTGAGDKAFVSGADIGELAPLDTRGAEEASRFGSDIFRRIELSAAPVIAAVNGFALGGGCELALACHIRYASDNAKFGLPEVGLGIIPGYGGTQRLPRIVGLGRANELIATGRMIDAEDALRIGLVNKVVPQAHLLDETYALACAIANNAPLAVAAALDAARRGLDAGIDTGLRLESTFFGILGSTEDMHAGLSAFLEKKKAPFKGK